MRGQLAGMCWLLGSIVSSTALAEITLYDQNQWKFSTSGFIQFDMNHDSTRSFREVVGSGAVARPDTADGSHGRTQFSVRHTRLAFTAEAPVFDGWKSRGYIEFDFLGYNPQPGTQNSEGSFFNNSTFRMRHAFIQAEHGKWQVLAGQWWGLLGWQPYYFVHSVTVAPIPGFAFKRMAQLRVTREFSVSDQHSVQVAAAAAEPPQADSELPDLEAGVRWSYSGWQSGYAGASASSVKLQPLSLALSGALRRFVLPTTSTSVSDVSTSVGSAVVVNTLVPVLTSTLDARGTLSLLGEFSGGKGYGDQFPGLSGNMASPLSKANTSSGPYQTLNANGKMPSLDAGLGDYDSAGNFHLLEMQTYNVHLQYHLPLETLQWVNLGMTQVDLTNMNSLLPLASGTRTSDNRVPYDKIRTYFVSYFRNLTSQVRVGAEYSRIDMHYGDGIVAINNRFQLSGWFLF